jgi:hypothetical protein
MTKYKLLSWDQLRPLCCNQWTKGWQQHSRRTIRQLSPTHMVRTTLEQHKQSLKL